jgi:hypothetical protein
LVVAAIVSSIGVPGLTLPEGEIGTGDLDALWAKG